MTCGSVCQDVEGDKSSPLYPENIYPLALSVVLKLCLHLAVGGAFRSHPILAFPPATSEKLMLLAQAVPPLPLLPPWLLQLLRLDDELG